MSAARGPRDTLDDRFAARMGTLLGPDFPSTLALAVSGGGDSMAMLALCHGWARRFGVALRIATVDHGLRGDSAAEAQLVAAECEALGHPHAVLRWDWDGRGNLQQEARLARLRLIAAWRPADAPVLFAHTLDDQSETVLMRLARGGGIDALAAMAPDQTVVPPGATTPMRIVRPLLGERRADLRHYATTLKVPFVEDPSNDDPRFERVRIRRALAALEQAGFDVTGPARSAAKLRRAGDALRQQTREAAPACVFDGWFEAGAAPGQVARPTGEIWIARDAFGALVPEIRLRLFREIVHWIGGGLHPPREAAALDRLDAAMSGAGGTLNGTQIRVLKDRLHLFREPDALRGEIRTGAPPVIWDRRWRFEDGDATWTVRALGNDGWTQLPAELRARVPFPSGLALPGHFEGDTLIACAPLAVGPAISYTIAPFRNPENR